MHQTLGPSHGSFKLGRASVDSSEQDTRSGRLIVGSARAFHQQQVIICSSCGRPLQLISEPTDPGKAASRPKSLQTT